MTAKDSTGASRPILNYCTIPHGRGRSIEEDTSADPKVYRYRGVYQPRTGTSGNRESIQNGCVGLVAFENHGAAAVSIS